LGFGPTVGTVLIALVLPFPTSPHITLPIVLVLALTKRLWAIDESKLIPADAKPE
jgi:glucose uptake protein GlcU